MRKYKELQITVNLPLISLFDSLTFVCNSKNSSFDYILECCLIIWNVKARCHVSNLCESTKFGETSDNTRKFSKNLEQFWSYYFNTLKAERMNIQARMFECCDWSDVLRSKAKCAYWCKNIRIKTIQLIFSCYLLNY